MKRRFTILISLLLAMLSISMACNKVRKNTSQLSVATRDRKCTDYPGGWTIDFTGDINLSTKAFTATYKDQGGKGFVHGSEDVRKLVADKSLWKTVPGDHYLDYRLDTVAWGCDISVNERESTPGRGLLFGSCESKTYQVCVDDVPPVADICGRGTCETQCTSRDSIIPIRPLPSAPDINNGNYVDCFFACREMKDGRSCSENTNIPWLEGKVDNLDKGDQADILIYEKGSFRAYADRGFTPQDRDQLKTAFDIAFEQLGVLFLARPATSDFGRCTLQTKGMKYEPNEMADLWGANFWDKNTYGYANIWREPRQPYQRLIPGYPAIKYDVRVVKAWDDEILGSAVVGNQSVARPVIALNWNYLKGYTRKGTGFVKNKALSHPGEWARVITHEILHTIGYKHPVYSEAIKNEYNATFMVAFSDCIREVSLPPDIKLSESALKVD